MSIVRNIFLSFLLFQSGLFVHGSALAQHSGNNVFVINEHLDYMQFSSLRSALNNNPSIDTLIITSPGGEISISMKVAELVFVNELNVIVKDYCYSSCANYILAAGKQVTVEEGALIGWHGGASQHLYIENIEQPATGLIQNKNGSFSVPAIYRDIDLEQQEIAFFKKMNVEQVITVLGMMQGNAEKRTAPVFSYDLNTLRRLGLNIEFAQPQKNIPNKLDIFSFSDKELEKFIAQHNEKLDAQTYF